jgi:hypothetical protein
MSSIQHISALTLAVRNMQEAVMFFTQLGFEAVHGGSQGRFSTMQAGDAYVNLILTSEKTS